MKKAIFSLNFWERCLFSIISGEQRSIIFQHQVRPIKPVLHHVLWLRDTLVCYSTCVCQGMCPEPKSSSRFGACLSQPTLLPPHNCTSARHFCFWTVKMRGMSKAVWELGKCHNPTLGVANGTRRVRPVLPGFSLFTQRHDALILKFMP